MNKSVTTAPIRHLALPAIICLVILAPAMLVAGGKEHPLQGLVIALGISRYPTCGGSGFAQVHRTYTVKTGTRIFALECPNDVEGINIPSQAECGGKKKFAIGDTIHFRIEKSNAFVLSSTGSELKLTVTSEAMSESAPAAPAQP